MFSGVKWPDSSSSIARFELGVAAHELRRRVALGALRDDFFGRHAEDEMFSAPTASRISMFAPSSVPIVSAPFSDSFMLPVPEASMPAVEICSDRSAAGMISCASDTS